MVRKLRCHKLCQTSPRDGRDDRGMLSPFEQVFLWIKWMASKNSNFTHILFTPATVFRCGGFGLLTVKFSAARCCKNPRTRGVRYLVKPADAEKCVWRAVQFLVEVGRQQLHARRGRCHSCQGRNILATRFIRHFRKQLAPRPDVVVGPAVFPDAHMKVKYSSCHFGMREKKRTWCRRSCILIYGAVSIVVSRWFRG